MFKKIPWKTSLLVYFTLILANKSTPLRTAASEVIWQNLCDGFCSADVSRTKWLEYLFWNENIPRKKSAVVHFFYILANKALHDE